MRRGAREAAIDPARTGYRRRAAVDVGSGGAGGCGLAVNVSGERIRMIAGHIL